MARWSSAVGAALLLAGCSDGAASDAATDDAPTAGEQQPPVAEADPEADDPTEPGAAPGPEEDDAVEPDPAPEDEADGSGEAGEQADPDGEGEAGEPAEPGEPEEPDDVPTSSGTGEHRPPPAAQALADCTSVTDPPPGAIIVFPSDNDPSWLEAGPGPVVVEFIGCSESFEANLQYEAFYEQDTTPTLSGITQGGTLGTWEAFSFEDTYWTPGDWTVVVFVNDALTGQRVEYDEVTFTVD